MAGPSFENTVLPWEQIQERGDQRIPEHGLFSTHQGRKPRSMPTGDTRSLTEPSW